MSHEIHSGSDDGIEKALVLVSIGLRWDGLLRDAVIRDCTVNDWLVLFDSLDNKDRITVVYPSSGKDFWSDPASVFSRYRGQAIVVKLNDIRLK